MARTTTPIFAIIILAALAFPAPAGALDHEIESGRVRAIEGDEAVWENVFDYSKTLDAKYVSGPVLAGEDLYYSAGSWLYDADPNSGAVRRTIPLPGLVKSMKADGEKLVLEVGSDLAVQKWTRTYTVTPEGHDIPFTLTGNLRTARIPRGQALAVVTAVLERGRERGEISKVPGDANWKAEGPFIPLFEEAAGELARQAERDPTNPWYHCYRGKILDLLGRTEEAGQAFRDALSAPEGDRYRLLGMVLIFDEHDTALGDEAFRLALESLISKGFEPEMMNTLISLMIHYGSPLRPGGKPLDPVKDLDRLNALGERIWDLAPLAEAACFAYNGLAIHNENAGNDKLASLWRSRRDAADPYRVFGGANRYARITGHALNLVGATGIALWFFLIITMVRLAGTIRRAPKKKAGDYNVFAYWTKPELAGFLALSLVGIYAMFAVHRGVSAIAISAAAPISSFSGTWGHPDTLGFLEKTRGNEGGDFLYALSLQKMGEDEEADKIYSGLKSAEALNNRGVIAGGAGRAEEARQFFEKALETDPGLAVAKFNLGREADSPRILRMTRYGAKAPLLAMPTVELWSEAYAAPSSKGSFLRVMRLQSLASPSSGPNAEEIVAGLISMAFILFICVLILIALFQPTLGIEYAWRSPSSLVGWGLGFLAPGAARQYTVLGPFVLCAAAFSYLVFRAWTSSRGIATNLIEAVSTPGTLRAYGFGEVYQSPDFAFVVSLRHLWWILLMANAAFLAIMAFVWPDPVGATGEAPPREEEGNPEIEKEEPEDAK